MRAEPKTSWCAGVHSAADVTDLYPKMVACVAAGSIALHCMAARAFFTNSHVLPLKQTATTHPSLLFLPQAGLFIVILRKSVPEWNEAIRHSPVKLLVLVALISAIVGYLAISISVLTLTKPSWCFSAATCTEGAACGAARVVAPRDIRPVTKENVHRGIQAMYGTLPPGLEVQAKWPHASQAQSFEIRVVVSFQPTNGPKVTLHEMACHWEEPADDLRPVNTLVIKQGDNIGESSKPFETLEQVLSNSTAAAAALVLPEVEDIFKGHGSLASSTARTRMIEHGWDSSVATGSMLLNAHVMAAVLRAGHDYLEARGVSHRVLVGCSRHGKQAVLVALLAPAVITHLGLASAGPLGSSVDAVMGPCGETTRAMAHPNRWQSWVGSGLDRLGARELPIRVDDLHLHLVRDWGIYLFIYVGRLDLWANPLGTVASYQSLKQRLGSFEQHKVALFLPESSTHCGEQSENHRRFAQFVRGHRQSFDINAVDEGWSGEGAAVVQKWLQSSDDSS